MILIVTLESKKLSDLIDEITDLKKYQFDYVEFRIDYYKEDILEALTYLKNNNLKIIATNRYEGSTVAYDEQTYLNTYLSIIDYVDMMDLEILRINDKFKSLIAQTKIIGSYHNFNNVEVDWDKLLYLKQHYQLQYLKVALQINKKTDLKQLLNKPADCCIGMGIMGKETRVDYAKYNSELIYCSLNGNSQLGQLPVTFYQNS